MWLYFINAMSLRLHVKSIQEWIGNYQVTDELFETILAAGFGGQRVDVIPELNLISVFTSMPDDNPKGHNRISQIMEKYILPSIEVHQ